MGIVVEIVGRNGSIIRTQSCKGNRVTIGRGFDCDIILNDLHVDASHLTISLDELSQGLECHDDGSLNGTWLIEPSRFEGLHKNKRQLIGAGPIFSGQALMLGRTYIKIYSSAHWVPAAQPLSAWEEFGHFLGRYWLVSALALCVVVLETWDAYLDAPQGKQVFQYVLSGISPVVAAAIYALIWSVVSKSTRHDGKYLTYMSVGLAAALLLTLIKLFLPNVVYGLGWGAWESAIYKILAVLVVYGCLLATLIFASHLKPLSRHFFAVLFPLIFLIPSFVGFLSQSKFQSQPAYDQALAPPEWWFRDSVDIDEFLDHAQKTYVSEEENEN